MLDRVYCRNFRRLAEADLKIRPGITILLGLNGTGKSSLMEAILFNLFGKVKSNTKKETARRKGATEEEITITVVDFTINGEHYRCRRWYSKKMSILADLYVYTDEEYEELQKQTDLAVLNKELGTELASSATGVTAEVASILNVSYEGFKASFMAQQKELDAMSNLTPETRKRFFLDLLGYSRLDDIKPEVSKKLRDSQKMVEIIEKQNLSVPELEREIKKHEKEIATDESRITKGTQMTEQKKQEYEAASTAYEESRAISEKAAAFRQDVDALAQERTRLVAQIDQLRRTIEENKKKAAGYDEKSSLSTRIADARDKVAKAREVSRIRTEKEQAEGSLAERQNMIDANKKKIDMLAVKTSKEPDLDSAQATLSALKEERAALIQERNAASSSRAGMHKLLASADAGDAAKCPTCGSEISTAEGRAHLEGEIKDLDRKLTDIEQKEKVLDEKIAKAADAVELARMALRTYQKDIKDKDALERENAVLSQDMDTAKKRIEEFARQLSEKVKDELPIVEVRRIEEQIAELNQKLARENEMKAAYYAVITDEQTLKASIDRLAEVEASGKEKQEFLKANRKVIDNLENRRAKKQKTSEELEKYRNVLAGLQQKKAQVEGMLSAANGNLLRAKEQAETLVTQKDMIENYYGAQQVVEYLRKTLPARIAPRLALEASNILDIATNGRYSMIELDDSYEVFVYTDDDIRPISMMSGGETDVISLCVRIAIAKLILETTGITDQTFILDEIFGALDDERKESTCQALKNIGYDLSKIICITHIDEIKDMADWTYIVEMDENGVSHVREQDNSQTVGKQSSDPVQEIVSE